MDWNREQLIALGAEYGRPALEALAILVVGWIVAKLVGATLRKVLEKTDWDNRLAQYIAGDRAKDLPIEEGVGKLGYWLVMLMVLMAVFQSLGLTIITEPLNALVTKITSFLPQLLGAAVLAAIAWAVATVLRIVVTNLLTAFQLDRKVGESSGDESMMSLSKTLADAVYYLVFLLFLPQILDTLEMEGLGPVRDMVGEILIFLPKLFGAAIVFLVFYFVARIVQRLVTNLLTSVGFDAVPTKLGLSGEVTSDRSASTLVGWLVLVVLLAMGLVQALNTLNLGVVSGLAQELLEGLFKIVVATVIFAVGLFVSNLAHGALSRDGRGTLAWVARAAILIFTGAMALHRADLAPEIVNLAFGALIVGLALAAGLAFGLGGREAAARSIEGWSNRG